jgi:lipopolysaccharide export LptBFGC system permease protein LptF
MAVVAWVVLVPWDLSQADADGNRIGGGADDAWGRIALVLAVVVVVAAALVFMRAHRYAVGVASAGAFTWVVLFAWRVGTARTVGANLFLVPLVVMVVPGALIAVVLVAALDHSRQRRAR